MRKRPIINNGRVISNMLYKTVTPYGKNQLDGGILPDSTLSSINLVTTHW